MNENIKINRYKTASGINIIHIKTNKFKTNIVNLFVHCPLDKRSVTKNALLPMVLKRGSKDFQNMRELSQKLESLYGSSFDCGIVKKGERQIMHFYIDCVNDSFIQEKILGESLDILASIVSNPQIKNKQFSEEYVKQEKENLSKIIKSRVNDKVQYAIDRCFEIMCKNEKFGIYEYGNTDHLVKITSQSLATYYKRIIKTSKIDIMIIGDIEETIIKGLNEKLNLSTNNENTIPPETVIKEVKRVRTVIEDMDVNQGKLTMGFRTNVHSLDKNYYTLLVYANILGGGSHSKLFQNVREKAGLAYYAFARLEKLKGIMIIGSGIEATNYKKAKKIILDQLEEIKKGNISEFEFSSSIKMIENTLKSMADEPMQLTDFYLGQSILGIDSPLEDIIEKIKAVTIKDIIEVAKQIQLDTVHLIKPRNLEIKKDQE